MVVPISLPETFCLDEEESGGVGHTTDTVGTHSKVPFHSGTQFLRSPLASSGWGVPRRERKHLELRDSVKKVKKMERNSVENQVRDT